jgi:D-arabinitol 2-dehydrogenase
MLNGTENADFEGTLARTDSTVQVEHPPESDLPTSEPAKGRGGVHYKRTLSSFSLAGKVGVVTGGARGLGLMMSQALIISGADLAIVDLDSK